MGGVQPRNRYDFLLVTNAVATYDESNFRFQHGCSKEEEVKVEDPQPPGISLEALCAIAQHL